MDLLNDYDLIPVYKTVPADTETPVSVYLKTTAALPGSFLLESGDLGEKARYSFIGLMPFISLYTENNKTVVSYFKEHNKTIREELSFDDPLEALNHLFEEYKVFTPEDIPGFRGGAVGYLSYDMIKYWERIPPSPHEEKYPRCFFNFHRMIAIYDHRRHLLTVVSFVKHERDKREGAGSERENLFEAAVRDIKDFLWKLKNNTAVPSSYNEPEFEESYNESSEIFKEDDFISAVYRAKEYIKAGDIFQVVLSRRVNVKLNVHPFNLYRALRSLNPSPYQFYLSFEGFQVLGASPEMLVSLKDRTASTKPIAGTRPRGIDKKADICLAKELSCDEKEKAEHMMLVDLGRNDLGKVSEYGTVKVDKLFNVEYFSHVIHLTTEVTGKVRKDCGFAQLIRAAFPAGTVTGAPKVRAMEIIAETEPSIRGPYAGAVGYVGFDGDMDTCIAIRTIITGNNIARVQAGAGIVADSEPDKEFSETEHKMAASLNAINLAEEWEKDDFNN